MVGGTVEVGNRYWIGLRNFVPEKNVDYGLVVYVIGKVTLSDSSQRLFLGWSRAWIKMRAQVTRDTFEVIEPGT